MFLNPKENQSKPIYVCVYMFKYTCFNTTEAFNRVESCGFLVMVLLQRKPTWIHTEMAQGVWWWLSGLGAEGYIGVTWRVQGRKRVGSRTSIWTRLSADFHIRKEGQETSGFRGGNGTWACMCQGLRFSENPRSVSTRKKYEFPYKCGKN